MSITNFPTLYGKPSKGDKIKQWMIHVEPRDDYYVIIRTHGYIGYKQMTSQSEVKSGKNLGKKNETTIEQQAISQAKSMWVKQTEQGMSEEKNIEKAEVTFLPMLAHDYHKRGKDIKAPFYVQPKLDGVRMSINKGDIISRTGKPYVGFEHIKDAVKELKLSDTIHLDGELFTFDFDFETLCSIARKSKVIDEKQTKMKFYVFDFYDSSRPELTFEQRLNELKRMKISDPLVMIDTQKINDKEELKKLHEDSISNGYEGIMLRNMDGEYKPNYRSVNLQKYKTFQDAEYKIVSCSEAGGNDKGTVIFICLDKKTNSRFNVRPKGTREQRREWFENFDKYENKLLTVQYQNLSSDGIPRFPVGIAIRDYE